MAKRMPSLLTSTARGGLRMGTIFQYLRYAVRILLCKPAFTAVAVVTIALGIGANVTIFSFVDAFFYRPLPAKDTRGLVAIEGSEHGVPDWGFSYSEYAYFPDHAKSFETLAAHYSTPR